MDGFTLGPLQVSAVCRIYKSSILKCRCPELVWNDRLLALYYKSHSMFSRY